MRRWNGWGDESQDYPLPEKAQQFLRYRLGPGTPPHDAQLADVAAAVPASRLPDNRLVTVDPLERIRHARGQSLPDWVALRSGRLPVVPDGVAYPTTTEHVQELLRYAARTGARLIPYGGGTSVVGHINPLPGDRPVLTVDMSRCNRLRELDDTSQLATFGAGVSGPDLEAQLLAHGYTLGHYPQSFEYSTLGGWIATRSSGQQSMHYGRIEALFAGGEVLTPRGVLPLPPFPASAAGPDLRELVLGSEGRLGVIAEATVRVSPLPERDDFYGLFFPDFERGQQAVRAISQARLPLSMLRLSTAVETETTLALAGHETLIGLLEGVLGIRGVGDEKALLLVGLTGRDRLVSAARKELLGMAGDYGGVNVGRPFGDQWQKGRFHTPYLRNTLWSLGYAVDTVETAVPWARVPATIAAVEASLRGAMTAAGEKIHVFSHLSHLYPSGSSLYTTFLFRLAADPDETLARWRRLKTAVSQAIVDQGGTISHQHGVGVDHAPYLAAEKGTLGLQALDKLLAHFDPDGLMNPGKLLT